MNKNIGSTDRVLRIVFALVVFAMILLNVINGTLALVLGILAGILFVTALIGICPLYALFGFSTKK